MQQAAHCQPVWGDRRQTGRLASRMVEIGADDSQALTAARRRAAAVGASRQEYRCDFTARLGGHFRDRPAD